MFFPTPGGTGLQKKKSKSDQDDRERDNTKAVSAPQNKNLLQKFLDSRPISSRWSVCVCVMVVVVVLLERVYVCVCATIGVPAQSLGAHIALIVSPPHSVSISFVL